LLGITLFDNTVKGARQDGAVGAVAGAVNTVNPLYHAGVAAVEIDTSLVADADASERTIHFRLGATRPARAVRIAQDLIFDVDEANHLAGVWLLNVPPFPSDP
jgi:hypothetical protein